MWLFWFFPYFYRLRDVIDWRTDCTWPAKSFQSNVVSLATDCTSNHSWWRSDCVSRSSREQAAWNYAILLTSERGQMFQKWFAISRVDYPFACSEFVSTKCPGVGFYCCDSLAQVVWQKNIDAPANFLYYGLKFVRLKRGICRLSLWISSVYWSVYVVIRLLLLDSFLFTCVAVSDAKLGTTNAMFKKLVTQCIHNLRQVAVFASAWCRFLKC